MKKVSSETHVAMPIEKELIEKYLKPAKENDGLNRPLYKIINDIIRGFYENGKTPF